MQLEQPKQYVGLDVHKKTIYGYVMDKEGRTVFSRAFKTEPHEMDMFLLNVRKEDSVIAIESCSCWQYAYDYLRDKGYYGLVLAHPPGVEALKKLRKHTDKDDAQLLADLLRTNMLPRSYAAPMDIRIKRQITRHRTSITELRTQVENKVHAILRRHGMDVPWGDAFCKKAITYLRSIDLPMCDRLEMDQYVDIIEMLNLKREEAQERIEELAGDDPAIRLVMTMPGMAHFNSTGFVAEMGDIRRFPSGDKLASYFGLTPSIYQSGETCRTGRITKRGTRHGRWIMIQAANNAVQHDKLLGKMYQKLAPKVGHNKAVAAVARRMVTFLHTMLSNNITYQALQIHKAQ